MSFVTAAYRTLPEPTARWITTGLYAAQRTFPQVTVTCDVGLLQVPPRHVVGGEQAVAAAVAPSDGGAVPGDGLTPYLGTGVVELREHRSQRLLGHAFASHRGRLAPFNLVRSGATDLPPLGVDFWVQRLVAASQRRQRYLSPGTDAYRVVNGALDGVPGLFIDRFARTFMVAAVLPGARALLPVVHQYLKQAFDGYEIAYTASPLEDPVVVAVLPAVEQSADENGVVLPAAPASVGASPADGGGPRCLRPNLRLRGARGMLRSLSDGRRVAVAADPHGAFTAAAVKGGAGRVVSCVGGGDAMQAAAVEAGVARNSGLGSPQPAVVDGCLATQAGAEHQLVVVGDISACPDVSLAAHCVHPKGALVFIGAPAQLVGAAAPAGVASAAQLVIAEAAKVGKTGRIVRRFDFSVDFGSDSIETPEPCGVVVSID